MNKILIGVDASERSEDAIAFGRRLAEATGAEILVENAYPYSDFPSRGSNADYRAALRDESLGIVNEKSRALGGRAQLRVAPDTSPARALHRTADAERAALIVVGSTHTGRAGRALPGSTGERLLHGSPCSVAVVPRGYVETATAPIKRIGVGYNGTDEAKAAANAAAELARALHAELELIGVVSAEAYGAPALMGGPSVATLRADIEQHVQQSLDELAAELPREVDAITLKFTGDPAQELATRSEELDLLVVGSRGYGPLRSVLVGGVSGRVIRSAYCPVIVVPRGIEAPLSGLFGERAAAAV